MQNGGSEEQSVQTERKHQIRAMEADRSQSGRVLPMSRTDSKPRRMPELRILRRQTGCRKKRKERGKATHNPKPPMLINGQNVAASIK